MKTPSLTADFSARGISYLMTKVFLQKNDISILKTMIVKLICTITFCLEKKSELTYAFPNLSF